MVTLTISPDQGFFHLGATAKLVAKVADEAGTAVDPGAILFRTSAPDGSLNLVGAAKVAVGTWTALVVLAQSGLWHFRVECVGNNAGVDETQVDVERSVFPVLGET